MNIKKMEAALAEDLIDIETVLNGQVLELAVSEFRKNPGADPDTVGQILDAEVPPMIRRAILGLGDNPEELRLHVGMLLARLLSRTKSLTLQLAWDVVDIESKFDC